MFGRDHRTDASVKGIFADLYSYIVVHGQSAGLVLIRGIHEEWKIYTLSELLPEGFGPENLE